MLVVRNILEEQNSISLDIKNATLKCKKVIVNPFMEEYLKLDTHTGIVYVNSYAKLNSLSNKIGLTFSLEKNVSEENNYISLIGLDPQISSSTIWDNYSNSLEEYEYYWITNGTDTLRTSPGSVLALNGKSQNVQDPECSFIWMNSTNLDVSKVSRGTAKRFKIYSLIPILYHYYHKLEPKTIEEIASLLLNTLTSLGSPDSLINAPSPIMISKFIGKEETTFVDALIEKLFDMDSTKENCASLLSQRIHNATTIAPPKAVLGVEIKKEKDLVKGSISEEDLFVLYLNISPNEDKDTIEYSIGDFKYPNEYESVEWKNYIDQVPLNNYYNEGLFTKQILIRSSRSNEDPLFQGRALTSSIIAIPAGKEDSLFGDTLKIVKDSNSSPLSLVKEASFKNLVCNPSL